MALSFSYTFPASPDGQLAQAPGSAAAPAAPAPMVVSLGAGGPTVSITLQPQFDARTTNHVHVASQNSSTNTGAAQAQATADPYIATEVTTKNSAESHANAQASQQFSAFFETHIRPHLHGISSLESETISHWFAHHKNELCLSALGALYGYLVMSVFSGNLYMHRKNTWASWKAHLTQDEILQCTQQELQNSLITDIYKKHFAHSHNHIGAMIAFMKEVELEEKRIRYHLRLCRLLRKLSIAPFCGVTQKNMRRARFRRRRLAFVKHLWASWAADQNLQFNG